jgi:hypothetical protein
MVTDDDELALHKLLIAPDPALASGEDQARSAASVADLVRDFEQAGEDPYAPIDLVEEDWNEDPTPPLPGLAHMRAGVPAVATRMRQVAALYTAWGGRVLASPGWETRGRDTTLVPAWHMVHHTAATVDVDRVLIEGRPDVPGPLCNFAFHADQTLVLLAAGRANQAGVGVVSSSQALGTEATGPPLRNRPGYVLLAAAVCLVHGWSAARTIGHKESARPEGRKQDPDFANLGRYDLADMGPFRRDVQAVIDRRGPAAPEELTMALSEEAKADVAKIVRAELYELLRPAIPFGQDHPNDVFRVLVQKAIATEQLAQRVDGRLVALAGADVDETALAAALAPKLAPAVAGPILEAIAQMGGQVAGVSADDLADQLVRVLHERYQAAARA